MAGIVRHDGTFKDPGQSSRLRRAMEMQGRLVTLSNAGIKVHNFETPEADLSLLEFSLGISIFEGCE